MQSRSRRFHHLLVSRFYMGHQWKLLPRRRQHECRRLMHRRNLRYYLEMDLWMVCFQCRQMQHYHRRRLNRRYFQQLLGSSRPCHRLLL